ncbi:hypothetical protein TNIN_314811 [Trichonephila inaurata madagascariensis]|uniref:Uncharacterized protein n=1 Tax=Trichonephila inaurata madagascariensis TaxID=2747483 RepID=A0A8X6XQM5_9ARAC|nr:hypothetical protein TNIN_314811 [Trichonephila inaurata madagascariensis]
MNRDKVFCNLVDKVIIPYFYGEVFPINLDSYSIEPPSAQKILTDEYNYLVINAINVQRQVIIGKWIDFLEDFFKIMLSSPRMYVLSVVCMCQVVVDFTTDIYERFLSVCCLPLQIGEFACKDSGLVFYKLTPYILKEFYAEVLKDSFYKRGGWQRLERYLRKQDYIILKILIDHAESDSEESPLVTELSNYIKEKIKTLEYDPSAMVLKKINDDLNSIAKDITHRVISSLEVPLLEELMNSSIIEQEDPLAYNLIESTTSNSKYLLPIAHNAADVGSGEFKILEWHVVPEATRVESVSESEENAYEENLIIIKKLVDENISSSKISNTSVSNNDTLSDIMKTLDQLKYKIEYLISAFESLDS